jgi:Ca2+-transporting ATPase
MEFHAASPDAALKELGSSPDGLSKAGVAASLRKHGRNELLRKKRPGPLEIFVGQFKSAVVLLLFAAAIIAGVLGEVVDSALIFAIVIFNAVFGTYQEFKAEKAMEALEELAAPTAKVMRDGREETIPAKELVPGDIIILETGDRVPADARIIEEFNLKCDEAALTGESVPRSKLADPVEASAPLADRKSMVFMNTVVSYGRARAVVTATGMRTEVGRIATLIQGVEEVATPLQQRLDEVGRKLGLLVVAISAGLFLVELFESPATLSALLAFTGDFTTYVQSLAKTQLIELFLVAVSLAVAAIPEGLPAVVTITLALGMQRMARQNAVVRKLPAVETLGSTTIICSDKTGTLTRNEMVVTSLFVHNKEFRVSGKGYEPKGEITPDPDADVKRLCEIAAHCNDARLQRNEKWSVAGDPTEGCLIVLAKKAGVEASFKRVDEIPFESERKRMTTVHETPRGLIAFTKGAPESVLEVCDRILDKGRVRPLTGEDREAILKKNVELASRALRNLGFAYKDLQAIDKKKLESGLVWVGLTGMIDLPRPEVKEALAKCGWAGIQVVMITGDNPVTAKAIAMELGMIGQADEVLTGKELEQLSEKELVEKVKRVRVFARAAPEHKLRIVKALQSLGHVSAVTGDGVNDAPALKTADIGVAMGITGTDVSKEASSMVLRDDNFATIVAAVEEGRRVYDNIKNFIKYLLSANLGEVIAVATAAFIGWGILLEPVQLLWVNLVTDGLPALALGLDKPDPEVMRRPPRKKEESVFEGLKERLVATGILLGFLTLFAFWLGSNIGADAGVDKGRSMAFATLVFFELVFVFNCRSAYSSVFNRGFLANRILVLAVGLGMALQLVIMYIPAFQPLFYTHPLGLFDWIVVLAFGLTGALPHLGNMWAAREK